MDGQLGRDQGRYSNRVLSRTGSEGPRKRSRSPFADIAVQGHNQAIDRLGQRLLQGLAAGERLGHVAEADDELAILVLFDGHGILHVSGSPPLSRSTPSTPC
jgi:hypothetical protein